jgi:hypothetical protein
MSDYATILEQQYHTLKYVAQLEALIPAGSLPDRPPEMPPRPGPPIVVDVPHVSGEGEVGAALTCTMGNWQGEPTSYAYDWDAMGADTSSATYTVDALDAGGSITCVVTATNAYGSTEAPPSNAIAVAGAALESASRGSHRETPRGRR